MRRVLAESARRALRAAQGASRSNAARIAAVPIAALALWIAFRGGDRAPKTVPSDQESESDVAAGRAAAPATIASARVSGSSAPEADANAAPNAAARDDAPRPATEDDYLRELTELRKTDRPAALAYARQGDDWYASTGRRAEARKAMAITLLVDLGRMEDARAETRAFLAAYPDSEYRRVVQGVTGIHPRPGKSAE
jgi:hypothetical protein